MSAKTIRLAKLDPTPHDHYQNRREFLHSMGRGGLTAAAVSCFGCSAVAQEATDRAAILPGIDRPDVLEHFPAQRNPAFNLGRKLTDELVAATHNNFYEFTMDKGRVWKLAQNFVVDPWTIEVSGQCHNPGKFDIDDIFKRFGADQQERTYRFRCVEAWAMDVPWTGFELNRLLEHVQPKSDAKFVRFVTALQRDQMPGIEQYPFYPWPYFEALRMDEAMHELTLLATGIYGRPLPRSHGAPFRIVVPWKYGYKSPKSIVKIELHATQPKTFWETLQPLEYPFESNVNPKVHHPRWSQAGERLIGGGRRATLLYNGYGEHVAKLYS